ncbi:MAG: 2-oxoacid:ferredoxin oxidoreductase subunit beta [bacterium]|nr:2-oxoacid:ferredoxin oxidoreductase subunit beta [bacterium]
MSTHTADVQLAAKDFASDQDVRWCPGCGDYSILAQMKKVLADLGTPREKVVFVSGIGCASRFPYYIGTYGFHSIHGRALGIATGLKATRPELSVWAVSGDGDMLSIGGNHLLHTIRRNVDINVIVFNNRTYGLTKGQYSPTSPLGMKTKSTPMGSIDYPLQPLSVAIGAEATFVARTVDRNVKHLQEVLMRAALHKGTSFVEIYQNCVIFNDHAFDYASGKSTKDDATLYLEHNRPLLFGKDRSQGIRFNGTQPEIVTLGGDVREDDLIFHDEKQAEPNLAYLLSRMRYPDFPEPMGVLRCVERPTYDDQLVGQVDEAIQARGAGRLEDLLDNGDSWVVE